MERCCQPWPSDLIQKGLNLLTLQARSRQAQPAEDVNVTALTSASTQTAMQPEGHAATAALQHHSPMPHAGNTNLGTEEAPESPNRDEHSGAEGSAQLQLPGTEAVADDAHSEQVLQQTGSDPDSSPAQMEDTAADALIGDAVKPEVCFVWTFAASSQLAWLAAWTSRRALLPRKAA